jgi:hypothetical protein
MAAVVKADGWVYIDGTEGMAEVTSWEGSVWLCHREPVGQHEAIAADIDAWVERAGNATPFRRVRWEFGRNPAMRQAVAALIGAADVDVAVLAVGRGELLDKFLGHDASLQALPTLLPSFESYLHKRDPTRSSAESTPTAVGPSTALDHQSATTAPIDIAKMVAMGKDLLAKRQPVYAHKFFAKALGVLDAIPAADHDDNMRGSVAVCLAWLIVTAVVLGRPGDAAALHARLREADYAFFARQPLSDAARGHAIAMMVEAAPFVWLETEASEVKLSEALKADPHDMAARAKLALTLFLRGDVERCLTEALKVHLVAKDDALRGFASAIFEGCAAFLGKDHDLIRRLGVNFGSTGGAR